MRGQRRRSPALTRVACRRTDRAAIWLMASSARAPAAASRPRASGATTCSTRPTSRSAAARKARRWRGSRPKSASSRAVWAMTRASVSKWPVPLRDVISPNCSSDDQQLLVDLGDLEQLLAREPHVVATQERLGAGHAVGGERDRRDGRHDRLDRRRLQAAVEGVEVLADHLQRQVVVALHRQHVAQPLDVGLGELAVARRRALGLDQPLVLEEADLGDRDRVEVGAQQVEDLADVEQLGRAPRRASSSGPGLAIVRPVRRAGRRARRRTPGGTCRSGPRRCP